MRTSRRGLTLIEIIVALAIMAMIGAISAGTLSSSIDVLDGMEEAEGSTRTARIAMRRHTMLCDPEVGWGPEPSD